MGDVIRESKLGLRTLVVITVAVLGVLTVTASASLVALTTSLHATADSLRQTVRGMRLAHESQVNLLRYDCTSNPGERGDIERALRDAVTMGFGLSVESSEAYRDHEVAKSRIDRYLAIAGADRGDASTERTAALAASLDALKPIVAATAARADEAQAHAGRLDATANTVGFSGAALMLLGLTIVTAWARRSLVMPIVSLAHAMERFGGGDTAARAAPRGPLEVRRAAEQFNVMGETLERQRQDRLTHLAGVAHDLRNPLGALRMSVALLDADESVPPEALLRRTFALVRRQLMRLSRMVDDLLDATRIDAGELALEIRPTDLRDAVRDVVELFGDVSEIHRLDVELPNEPVTVACDAMRIEQVLSNLVSNAIKYSPRGGTIRIRMRRRGDIVLASVSDEGIGIRECELERIWEPFRRSGVSKEAIPGVGLGLWTARRLVEAHQGELRVESVIGVGSTFTIALPVDPSAKTGEGGARDHGWAMRGPDAAGYGG